MIAREERDEPVPVSHSITERKRLQDEQRRQNEYLAGLHETALGLITRRDLDSLLQVLLDRAAALLGTSHAFIYLSDPDADQMELRIAAGAFRRRLGTRIEPGQGLAGRVWQTGRSLVLEGDDGDLRGPSPADAQQIVSRLGVPLLSGEQVVGVLGLVSEKGEGVFGFDEIAVLSQFARLASVAIDNARLYQAVRHELAERRRAEASLRQNEEVLRRSEARYRGFVEHSFQGIWEVDGEGMTTFVNGRMARILGYESAAPVVGRRFYEFFVPGYSGPPLDLLGAPGPGEAEVHDCLLRRVDGTDVYAMLSALPLHDEQGRFVGATLFVIDISRRKQIEEALRQSEARYRTLFESAGDAILIHDLDGHFLAANNLACQRLGYSLEELRGMGPADIEAPEYAARLEERIEALRYYGHHFFETVHIRRDGGAFPVELSSRLVEYEGRPAVLSIARDVTERRQMQQVLLRTERMTAMGHLAAALAHEINNPLQSISSSMELVLDFPLEEQERQEYLEAVRQEIERLMSVTGRILDFARPLRTEREAISMGDVVRYALSLAGKQLQHSHININLDLPEDLPPVVVSRDELAQVVLNLVINALEAMPGGGSLDITGRAAGGKVQVCFIDSGPGIPPDMQERLFEPFQTSKKDGTGLGLALSYSIIQQHGGNISAGGAPGGGARFCITLPHPALRLGGQNKEIV